MKVNMFKRGLQSVGTIILLLLMASVVYGGIPTDVVLNKSVVLNLKNPADRVTLANPTIADVLLLNPKLLQVNGTAVGSTTMIVWEKGHEKPSFFDLKVSGDQGEVEAQLKEMAPNENITAHYANETLVLKGNATSELVRKKAEEVAMAYSKKVVNHITINNPPQVLLEVKVAQLDKTALKNIGLSYIVKGATAEGFGGLVGAPAATQVGQGIGGDKVDTNGDRRLQSILPLDPYQIGVSYFPAGVGVVMQALVNKGFAKILAEPNLLVKSGQEGNFLAGSQIPYTILENTGGTSTTTIIWKDVGIKLRFKPEVMENSLIRLKIDPAEVSSIAGTLQVNGYPIIDIRTVHTNVDLKDGESLVLAGLLQEETIKSMSKIPILGDIPVLGALFRQTDDELKNKELVFFITPKLVQPLPAGTKAVLPTDNVPTPEQEKELQWIPLGS